MGRGPAVGRRIRGVDVTGMLSIRRNPNKKAFITRLEGKKVSGVERKGKYLDIYFTVART